MTNLQTLNSDIIKAIKIIKGKRISISSEKKEITQIVEWDYDKSCYDFANLMQVYSTLITETEFFFTENELEINALDPSRISIICMRMKIECKENFKMALNLDDFSEALNSRAKDNRKLRLEFTINSPILEKNGILIKKIRGKSLIEKFIPESDLDMENLPIENLLKMEYPSEFRISKNIISELFSEFSKKDIDILTIKAVENKGVTFSTKIQKNHLTSDYPIALDDFNHINLNGTQVGSYSRDFLEVLNKALVLLNEEDIMTFYIKTDHPLKVEFENEALGIKFIIFLAPRVEEAEVVEEIQEF